MMKRDTILGIIKRVLVNSAPFLLITIAVYLFALWGIDKYVEGNLYYRIATMAPSMLGDSDSSRLVLTEHDKEVLEDNNVGDAFIVPPSFPAIALGEQWATITIEAAHVYDVPVIHGDSVDCLRRGVGHYSNSRFPGQHGKVVLAAHVTLDLFSELENMNVGDTVKLHTIYGDYEYWVTDTVIFPREDDSLLLPEDVDTGDKLICYTCYPYYTTSARVQRFAIVCELVSGFDWTVSENIQNGGSNG